MKQLFETLKGKKEKRDQSLGIYAQIQDLLIKLDTIILQKSTEYQGKEESYEVFLDSADNTLKNLQKHKQSLKQIQHTIEQTQRDLQTANQIQSKGLFSHNEKRIQKIKQKLHTLEKQKHDLNHECSIKEANSLSKQAVEKLHVCIDKLNFNDEERFIGIYLKETKPVEQKNTKEEKRKQKLIKKQNQIKKKKEKQKYSLKMEYID